MTSDQALALSLLPLSDLPRIGLGDRLRSADPTLAELAARHLHRVPAIRRDLAARGFSFLAWCDNGFPEPLLAIGDCPPGLWYRGAATVLSAPCVAIVGARAASPVALETARRLAGDLAARGIVVVSGLARGVDSAAHRGALAAGRTVAVLGSGLDAVYPAEHAGLAERIAAAGAVVTEYPPGTPPLPFHFPMRNRIISGLGRAVVVIEASEKSGSLITAGCALEQGRDVMAVPGAVLGGRNRGAHALLRDGARIVETAEDVVDELWPGLGAAAVAPDRSDTTQGGATTSMERLLSCLAPGDLHDLDALAAGSGLDVATLLPLLSDLELAGRIRRVEGGRFVRAS